MMEAQERILDEMYRPVSASAEEAGKRDQDWIIDATKEKLARNEPL